MRKTRVIWYPAYAAPPRPSTVDLVAGAGERFDRPVQVALANEQVVGLERREDEDRHLRVGERRDECGDDACEREVERAGELERAPAPLRARVGRDVLLAADERELRVGARRGPEMAAAQPRRKIGVGLEANDRVQLVKDVELQRLADGIRLD